MIRAGQIVAFYLFDVAERVDLCEEIALMLRGERQALSDQQNALKFVGDIYAARLFGLVADRLGLDAWKANVQEKPRTLSEISRFALDQSSALRGQFLELTIVLILILELVLVFLGVMK